MEWISNLDCYYYCCWPERRKGE